MKPLLLMALPLYLFSFLLTFSSTHLMSAWVGLELNLISFLGLLVVSKQGKLDSSSMKYFVAQALGSVLLIMSLLITLSYLPALLGLPLFTASLAVKLGLFPFHSWFMSFGASCSMEDLWLVSIPQKLLPFWVTMYLPLSSPFVVMSLFGGLAVSISGGIKTSRTNLVLAFSSLMNTSWFLLLMRDMSVFVCVFFIYGASLLLVVMMSAPCLGMPGATNTARPQSWMSLIGSVAAWANLGGLPPFLNMWTKLWIITEVCLGGGMIFGAAYILSSGVYLYIYLNISLWGASLCSGTKTSWSAFPSVAPILAMVGPSVLPFVF